MKCILVIMLMSFQIGGAQNVSFTNTSKDSVKELNYLKPINEIKEELGKGKLGRKEENILRKYKKAEIGNVAYDFSALSPQEDLVRFFDLKSKFKLLVFASTGCPACIASDTELKLIHENYKDSLVIVKFYIDHHKRAWLYYMKEGNLPWACLRDGQARYSDTVIKYGVKRIPMFFLIDDMGVIIDQWVGYRDGSIEERLVNQIK